LKPGLFEPPPPSTTLQLSYEQVSITSITVDSGALCSSPS
jgi:hypothetical protein